MIEIKNLFKSYDGLEILKGINMKVEASEIVSIVGASGAGKTTLLQIIGTLDKPNKGEVWIKDKNICLMNDKQLASFRNKEIGFVYQFHNLLAEFTAIENVCIPAFIAGNPRNSSEKEAKNLLSMLNLDHRLNHKPNELSGGEKQRVAIARALINKPAVVLADEPSGNLDSKNAEELYRIIFDLREKTGQTFVIVTHNMQHAKLTDRTYTLSDGIFIE